MNSSGSQPQRPKLLGLAADSVLPVGLLLALAAVVMVDRKAAVVDPDSIVKSDTTNSSLLAARSSQTPRSDEKPTSMDGKDRTPITAAIESEPETTKSVATLEPATLEPKTAGADGKFNSIDGEDPTPTIAAIELKQEETSLLSTAEPKTLNDIPPVKDIFGLRTVENRQKMITPLGGTLESEAAVHAGLEWLARHQAEDGHWSDQGKCEAGQSCRGIVYGSDGVVAETGLAVLAFQAGGNYDFNDQKYSGHVKRGLDWLVEQQKKDGRLFGTPEQLHDTWYKHGIATFALAEACAVARANRTEPQKRYLSAAERAVAFMEQHQYKQGGWQYSLDSGSIGDTSVTGWQMLALKSAMEAEIKVSKETMQLLGKFFESVGDPATGRTGYQGRGGGTDLTTAVGLVFRQFILEQPDSPFAQKAVEHLKQQARRDIGRNGDFYTLYNGTLAMFLAGGEEWEEWNKSVRDAVVNRQVKAGCARGSWDDRYGRTLSTAWAVLTLEVYYRYARQRLNLDFAVHLSPENAELLKRLIHNPPPDRWELAQGAFVGPPSLVEELIQLLNDPNSEFQADISEALARLTQDNFYAVPDGADSRSQTGRVHQMKQRYSMQTPRGFLTRLQRGPRLSEAVMNQTIDSPNPHQRWAIARYLSDQVSPNIPSLIKLLSIPDGDVRALGRTALVRIAKDQDYGPEPGAAEDDIVKAVVDWELWHEERRAKSTLAAARNTLKSNPNRGKSQLQDLIKLYPDTEAALEAKSILSTLP